MPLQPDIEQRAREMVAKVSRERVGHPGDWENLPADARDRWLAWADEFLADPRAQALLALASSVPEDLIQWQQFETAPTDGTMILAAIEVHDATAKWWEFNVISHDPSDASGLGDEQYRGWCWNDYILWQPITPPEAPQDRGASQEDGR